MAADEVVRGRPATPIGNVGHVDADPRVEQRASKMRSRSNACRAVLHLRAVLFKQRDKFRKVVGGQVFAAFEHHRLVREERDRGEVAHRIIAALSVYRLIVGVCANTPEQHRIAVRLGIDHAFNADDAPCAGHVLHDH